MECGLMIGPGRMNAGGMPMSNLAQALSPQVGRIVLDKTELTGNYDFELTYALEALGAAVLRRSSTAARHLLIRMRRRSSRRLQEQLGLKLDSQRGPVDVVVIDRVEQPVAD